MQSPCPTGERSAACGSWWSERGRSPPSPRHAQSSCRRSLLYVIEPAGMRTDPRPLVDANILRLPRTATDGPLTLVDLSMPRNVDPGVRALPWVRLIDLADLRSDGMSDADDLAHDLAATEEIIETELQRYLRWLAEI